MRRTMLATKIARPVTAEPIFSAASAGVFEPTGHARGPWDPDALHGGAPAAPLVRAVSDLDTRLGLGRPTIDYLGPVPLAAPEEGWSSPFPVEGSAGAEDAFHRSVFDIRFVAGDYGRGPADVWFRLRRPLVDASPATPLEALAAAADFGNGVSHVLDFERFLFINLDLSIQVLRPPRGEWIGLAARTELSDDGTGVARSTLHDRDGPVGSAAQTLFVAAR